MTAEVTRGTAAPAAVTAAVAAQAETRQAAQASAAGGTRLYTKEELEKAVKWPQPGSRFWEQVRGRAGRACAEHCCLLRWRVDGQPCDSCADMIISCWHTTASR